ncbi:general receptor for phosphoinositides 1-associated scaffold protein [Alosa alosa]|uniref:general receptor for phosphoinositides 1-associated scaffold protein n=1 Tax=Alosa alosa TaxID=278164 RepID=UPI0020152388|nr:general receptor for phosphoinositides 1-associated scaffold protein [Alosa alosa]
MYSYETLAYSGGTLPRRIRNKWRPLTQSSELIRTNVVLEKNADETFGFEIQTYGLHHQNENSVEMCTFVCRVHNHSPAKLAGLKVGYTIACVNETSVEGCQHKEIVQLIRSSGNILRLETLYSDSIRKAELDARLQYLRQILHEKWDEYRSLMMQEQRLTHGIVMSDALIYESLESAGVYGSLGVPSPITLRAQHLWEGSNSSSASHLSVATDEDSLYQDCLYQGNMPTPSNSDSYCKLSLQLSAQRLLRPAIDLFATSRCSLTRSASTRSYLQEPENTASLSGSKQGWFGIMLPKPKQMSFPRSLLKFIPGLNHALEEEESKL